MSLTYTAVNISHVNQAVIREFDKDGLYNSRIFQKSFQSNVGPTNLHDLLENTKSVFNLTGFCFEHVFWLSVRIDYRFSDVCFTT